MSDLVIYLAAAVIGYFLGNQLHGHESLIRLTGKIQTIAIVLLIFTMGMRMGMNDQVMHHLDSIGIYALIMTISIMFCSALGITLTRKLMKLDRCGRLEAAKVQAETSSPKEDPTNQDTGSTMTVMILVCVVGGLVFGYFFTGKIFSDLDRLNEGTGTLITIGLCLLLFFVGFDMGFDGTMLAGVKQVGLRVIIFPFVIMAGTLAGALLCKLFLPLSVRELLAIGAGFGWYTFAPGIIMEKGFVTAGAVSFMHNIMREYVSILIIPLVARKAGYLESFAVAGCSSMDVCLPIIEKSTRGEIAMYGFVSGIIQSLAVPILVPLILG